mmetsp:Transcript_2014/g.6360  ORF Transcript_2014/g.6360 Transcript_2014/m.6360 type:complete len:232 (-) Transcript_2014:799-1494(-)
MAATDDMPWQYPTSESYAANARRMRKSDRWHRPYRAAKKEWVRDSRLMSRSICSQTAGSTVPGSSNNESDGKSSVRSSSSRRAHTTGRTVSGTPFSSRDRNLGCCNRGLGDASMSAHFLARERKRVSSAADGVRRGTRVLPSPAWRSPLPSSPSSVSTINPYSSTSCVCSASCFSASRCNLFRSSYTGLISPPDVTSACVSRSSLARHANRTASTPPLSRTLGLAPAFSSI